MRARRNEPALRMRRGASMKPLIAVQGMVKRFGTTTAVDGVDLNVHQGEVLVIIGPSGSGKSTLVRCINGLEEPSAGTVVFDGRVIERGDREAWRRLRSDVGM